VKIGANDIRVGNLLEIDGKLWSVMKTAHTQPGKGGAYIQLEMKDIKTGTKTNSRLRSSETVTKVRLDEKNFQYMYENGDFLEIMDMESYEQISVSKEIAGDNLDLLQEGMDVTVEYHNEEPLFLSLPETAVYEIEDCEPVVKGQTATSSYKPAKLTNGLRINVPQFVKTGDKILLKIETREYLERAE